MHPFKSKEGQLPLSYIAIVVAIAVGLIAILFLTRKSPERKAPPIPIPTVQVSILKRESLQLTIVTG